MGSAPIACLACGGDGCGLCRFADCALCLGTSSSNKNVPVSLQCGHTFCKTCLQTHVHTQLDVRQSVSCPVCRSELGDEDITALDCKLKLIKQSGATDFHELDAQFLHAQRAFRRAACQGHWKLCPACGVAIAKDGGCDRMQCRCGHRFSWRSAQQVEPCRSIHLNQTGVHAWGHTCSGCSSIATAKLTVVRTGVCMCALPVVTVVLAAASVPAVVFAPLAAIYEPLHRLKVSRGNPFKTAMIDGPLIIMGCGLLACQRVGILTLDEAPN